MSEKASNMSNVRQAIATVAGPITGFDNRESWLSSVPSKVMKATAARLTFRTVKSLWYGGIKDPEHWAARDIGRAAKIIEAQREARALASQYETIAGGLLAKDADFHSHDAAALIHAARVLRGLDSA